MTTFLDEVREQPRALRKLLISYSGARPLDDVRALARRKRTIVFAGLGASLYATIPAAVYLSSRGVPSFWLDAGELLHFTWPGLSRRDTLVVLVSQSGESFETVALAKLMRQAQRRPASIAVTNYHESPLPSFCDLTLPLHAGFESGTSSKTYLNSVALLLMVAGEIAGDRPIKWHQHLARTVAGVEQLVESGAETAGRMAEFLGPPTYLPVIGRGPSLASALETALVLKEAAAVAAEGFSGGGFRHGPYEMLSQHLPAIVFAYGSNSQLGEGLALDLARHGGRAVILGSPALPASKAAGLLRIALPAVEEAVSPILEVIPGQFLGLALGQARGREAGKLIVSGKVVRSE